MKSATRGKWTHDKEKQKYYLTPTGRVQENLGCEGEDTTVHIGLTFGAGRCPEIKI